jgi:hypothetical protein
MTWTCMLAYMGWRRLKEELSVMSVFVLPA